MQMKVGPQGGVQGTRREAPDPAAARGRGPVDAYSDGPPTATPLAAGSKPTDVDRLLAALSDPVTGSEQLRDALRLFDTPERLAVLKAKLRGVDLPSFGEPVADQFELLHYFLRRGQHEQLRNAVPSAWAEAQSLPPAAPRETDLRVSTLQEAYQHLYRFDDAGRVRVLAEELGFDNVSGGRTPFEIGWNMVRDSVRHRGDDVTIQGIQRALALVGASSVDPPPPAGHLDGLQASNQSEAEKALARFETDFEFKVLLHELGLEDQLPVVRSERTRELVSHLDRNGSWNAAQAAIGRAAAVLRYLPAAPARPPQVIADNVEAALNAAKTPSDLRKALLEMELTHLRSLARFLGLDADTHAAKRSLTLHIAADGPRRAYTLDEIRQAAIDIGHNREPQSPQDLPRPLPIDRLTRLSSEEVPAADLARLLVGHQFDDGALKGFAMAIGVSPRQLGTGLRWRNFHTTADFAAALSVAAEQLGRKGELLDRINAAVANGGLGLPRIDKDFRFENDGPIARAVREVGVVDLRKSARQQGLQSPAALCQALVHVTPPDAVFEAVEGLNLNQVPSGVGWATRAPLLVDQIILDQKAQAVLVALKQAYPMWDWDRLFSNAET